MRDRATEPAPRSTVFRSEELSKDEHERQLGSHIAVAYPHISGLAPEYVGRPKGDHPDALLAVDGLVIGIELTELDKDYDFRAWCERLTNAAYRAFDERGLGDRYLGVAINLLTSPDRGEFDAVRQRRSELGSEILKGGTRVRTR